MIITGQIDTVCNATHVEARLSATKLASQNLPTENLCVGSCSDDVCKAKGEGDEIVLSFRHNECDNRIEVRKMCCVSICLAYITNCIYNNLLMLGHPIMIGMVMISILYFVFTKHLKCDCGGYKQ